MWNNQGKEVCLKASMNLLALADEKGNSRKCGLHTTWLVRTAEHEKLDVEGNGRNVKVASETVLSVDTRLPASASIMSNSCESGSAICFPHDWCTKAYKPFVFQVSKLRDARRPTAQHPE